MSDQSGSLYRMAAGRSPSGDERRWEGVLTEAQMARLKARGATLAYDPAQIGWVRLEDTDPSPHPDASLPSAPLSWRVGLSGSVVTLRDWTLKDAPTYQRLLDDEVLWRYMPEAWPGQITLSMAEDLIRIAAAAPHHSVQAVMLGDETVGQVRLAFAAQDPSQPQAEISYWFGRNHWGKGLGRRVVRLATAQGFAEHPGLHSIIAHVHPDNHASAKVLIHAGYSGAGQRADGWRIFLITR